MERQMRFFFYQSKMGNPRRPKGGFITIPFIIANEAFEKVSSYGLMPNMILYLMSDYKMGLIKGTKVLNYWSSATNFMPIVGAFLADSYLGRFLAIVLGSIASLLGMTLLWISAMIPQAKPPPCNQTVLNSCKSPTSSQLTLLYSSFTLMSLGAGGIRPCSLAFGADQLDKKENPKNQKVLESYFGWYYASAAVSILIAFTGIVYIQQHMGWKVGYGVPVILMFFSAFLFLVASPLYAKQKVNRSLFTSFLQVMAVAYKNRKLTLPPQDSKGQYHHKKDSDLVIPTNKLRFLNKACIIKNPEQDITPDGSASNPWSLCTTDQIEELKALVKVIPLWSTGIMMSIALNHSSFQIIQANSMDRHLISTSSFQIPAGSFGMFTIIALTTWILLYDRAILPLASKLRGKPVRFGVKLRLGMGLLLSCIAMIVSAIVENVRRRRAIQQGFLNDANAVVGMSAMWLVPQYCLSGLAEAFNAIGQTEFYYSEFPKSMSSIASALFGLGMAVANALANVILSSVNSLTSRDGRQSWLSSNINRAHLDNYYWLLALMSCINLLYFMGCSWAYGPCVEKGIKTRDEEKGLEEEKEITKLETGGEGDKS